MKQQLIDAAMGRQNADLVFKNVTVADVFSQQARVCDVAIKHGVIAGLGEYHGDTEIDASGKCLLPAFIDGHCHIESTMLTPAQYARAVVPKGVLTAIADPHEIVNVCGEAGLKFMLQSSEGLPLDIKYMLPSCVPATPYDSAGCVVDSELTARLFAAYPKLWGLGEMMNYPGVIYNDADVIKKLELASRIDGHAPGLAGRELNAYIAAGITTDHECSTAEEAMEKLALGMYILIREGTGAKNLSELIKAVSLKTLRRFVFCSDDVHLDDILSFGTIKNCVDLAVKSGLDPIAAVTIATLNAAECFGLPKRGAIAPGYAADVLLCDSLHAGKILEVYKAGRFVAKDGEPLFDIPQAPDLSGVTNTVRIKPVTPADFAPEFTPGMAAIEVFPNTLYTKLIRPDTRDGLNLCAVIERHRGTGSIGRAFVKGFIMEHGAVAQSIGHDSHNIIVIGDNAADMAFAVNALGTEGGIAVAADGRLIASLELPIAGLISALPYEEFLTAHQNLMEALRKLSPQTDGSMFMVLSFLTLLVIPEAKLGVKGIFDVTAFKYLE